MQPTSPHKSILDAYSPQTFEQIATIVTSKLKSYFEDVEKSTNTPAKAAHTRPWQDPEVLIAKAKEFLLQPSASVEQRVQDLSDIFLKEVHRLHAPFSMGHQVAAPIPASGVFEMLMTSTNASAGIFEMGPFVTAIERAVVAELGRYLGWSGLNFDGIVTHGGSLANLTALLAARNQHFRNSWGGGVSGRWAVLCSEDTHYSISRAAGIIGVGANQVIKVPVGPNRKMNGSAVQQALEDAQAKGLEVFCIVGSACATPVGSFDHLTELGEVASKNRIWFHVDAAHGGGLLFSEKYRGVLSGIEKADSVTWDAHKMMHVPSLCTFLFYRNKKHSYETFEQDAPYLLNAQSELEADCDSARRAVECTKRALATPFWATWAVFGSDIFAQIVDRTIDTTLDCERLIRESLDFRTLHKPECNILCFRYEDETTKGWSHEKVSELHQKVRRRLLRQGHFYITGTNLDGVYTFRVTIMNPLTEVRHFEELLSTLRKLAREEVLMQ